MAHKCNLPKADEFNELFVCECGQMWGWFGFWAEIGK